MKKMMRLLSLLLSVSVLAATSALALTANHAYRVQLSTVSASGQQTALAQMEATANGDGQLSFQFSDVPDSDSVPFLMVEIMDTVGGQQQMVRQTLVPAPTPGQQMQMGVNELSHRQTQATMQALQTGTDHTAGAMFPLLIIPTGAITAADAENFGQAAAAAAFAFHDYLTQNGVTTTQMAAFQSAMLEAMREFAAANKNTAEQTDPAIAAGMFGQAGASFMASLIQEGAAAGIDPFLMSAAFDQAGQAIDVSTALTALPVNEIDAMHAAFLVDAQQRRLMSQLRGYAAAMPVVGADNTQTQTYTTAMNSLQTAMAQARQNYYQQVFADPENLPSSTSINQGLNDMATAMQHAFMAFDQSTTASDTQIDSLMGNMAGRMNGGGMMGGGMMSGSTLTGMGFGMMQASLGGAPRNWSLMMLATENLVATVPDLSYTPVTDQLAAQLTAGNLPTAPDWSQLVEGPDKSLLELQYDLMLVHLIDLQTLAGLTPPLTQDEIASLSAQNLANLALVREGLAGISEEQTDALLAALSPPWLCQLY